jgi:hypothetical protein
LSLLGASGVAGRWMMAPTVQQVRCQDSSCEQIDSSAAVCLEDARLGDRVCLVNHRPGPQLLKWCQNRTMPSDTAADPGDVSERCARRAANDACMRDFRLVVPRDCTVSNIQQQNDSALDQIRVVLKADVRPAAELDLESLVHPSGE